MRGSELSWVIEGFRHIFGQRGVHRHLWVSDVFRDTLEGLYFREISFNDSEISFEEIQRSRSSEEC